MGRLLHVLHGTGDQSNAVLPHLHKYCTASLSVCQCRLPHGSEGGTQARQGGHKERSVAHPCCSALHAAQGASARPPSAATRCDYRAACGVGTVGDALPPLGVLAAETSQAALQCCSPMAPIRLYAWAC